jgi:hypothetical protein
MTREARCSIAIRGVSISTDVPADGRRPRAAESTQPTIAAGAHRVLPVVRCRLLHPTPGDECLNVRAREESTTMPHELVYQGG